jgi:Zn-dependent protease
MNVADADQLVESLFAGRSINLEAIVDERKRLERMSTFVNHGEIIISSPGKPKQQTAKMGWVRQLAEVTHPSPIFLSILAAFFLSGVFLAIGPSISMLRLSMLVFIVSGWFVSLCLHEYGHAAAAFAGGDDSVYYAGYLTLNPLRYTNPLFSIVMPLLFLAMGGIPLPGGSVMIQTWKLRSRQAERRVHVAGPLTNVIFIALLSVPFAFNLTELIPQFGFLWFGMAGLLGIEVLVLCLNLLPVPQLDGFNIASYWMSYETQNAARSLGFYPLFLLYAMLWTDNPFSNFFYATVDAYLAFIQLNPDVAWAALSYIHF